MTTWRPFQSRRKATRQRLLGAPEQVAVAGRRVRGAGRAGAQTSAVRPGLGRAGRVGARPADPRESRPSARRRGQSVPAERQPLPGAGDARVA